VQQLLDTDSFVTNAVLIEVSGGQRLPAPSNPPPPEAKSKCKTHFCYLFFL